MKKLFVSILALTAFVACQSGFDGADVVVPSQNGANYGGSHTIYAEVGVGEVTKATYGDDFSAMWEEGDQLALLQEHADYGKTFGVVNKLNIKEGWGTSFAKFNGDISVDATSPRVYHIAYPAEAVTFGTSMTLTKNGETTYDYNDGSYQCGYWFGSAKFDYKYEAVLDITVPTTQNGEWTPYMYASTTEAVSSMGIGAQELTTLTGAIAIRAFEADGVTPKQLASVSIMSGDAPIAGAFKGVSISSASMNITGDATSKEYSIVSEGDIAWYEGYAKGKAAAEELLVSKARSTEPTTVAVTQSMSLAFAGTATTIEATNLENVAMDKDGFYTYHINVVPATVGSLTIVATATDGSSIVKSINNQTFKASARKGYTLKWEEATLTCGSVETWFDDYSSDASFNLEGNTIYANNIKVEGVAAENVQAIALVVGDQVYGMQSGVAEVAQIKAEGLASGAYTAFVYASVLVNGRVKDLTAAVDTYNVTTIPTVNCTVKTSYAENGVVAKTNSMNGDVVQVTANLSDAYVASNLVNGNWNANFTGAGSFTVSGAIGATATKSGIAYGNWGAYNCSVSVTLKNGYVCKSSDVPAYVTGIPYSYNFYSNGSTNLDAAKSAGWVFTSTGTQSDQVWICKGSSVGVIGSPKFYAPSSISTISTLSHRYYKASLSSDSVNAYVGASSSPSSAVKTATYYVSKTVDTGETGGLKTHTGDGASVTVSSSAPYITITSDKKSGVSYHYVHGIKIEYK